MSIRSMLMIAAIAGAAGCMDAGAADETATAESETQLIPFDCDNDTKVVGGIAVPVVACVGSISVLPVNVEIKDVDVLSNNDLTILEDSLNHVSILDEGILNNNKILQDFESAILTKFLQDFEIPVDVSDINVCLVNLLGIQLCK